MKKEKNEEFNVEDLSDHSCRCRICKHKNGCATFVGAEDLGLAQQTTIIL